MPVLVVVRVNCILSHDFFLNGKYPSLPISSACVSSLWSGRGARQNIINHVVVDVPGIPRLTGTGTVTVLVEDDNDNSPQFQYAHYVARIQENLPPGSDVVQVYAIDRDQDKNAEIRWVLDEFRWMQHEYVSDSFTMITLDYKSVIS